MPNKKQKTIKYQPTVEEQILVRQLRDKIVNVTRMNGSVDPLIVDLAFYDVIAKIIKEQ